MKLTQYQITHLENRMLVDSEWPDPDREKDDFDEDEEFEDDDIDEF